MQLPTQPITLTPEQVAELHRSLSTMRHDVNNYLSLIFAAAELIRYKPEALERMSTAMMEQPQRVVDAMKKFSAEFDRIITGASNLGG